MNAGVHPATASEGWRPWRPCAPALTIRQDVLAETLSGGQAFRWRRLPEAAETWQGVWADQVARVRVGLGDRLEWTAPADRGATAAALAHYFAADVDFAALAGELPWRTDSVLKNHIASWPGLRLLRQPLGETLLIFLCSSAKTIPQIARMGENLAENFGEPLAVGVRALPSWPRLAATSEAALRRCALGYRARFIKATADRLAAAPDWETRLRAAPCPEAHAWLTALPGVGPKIADCVLLFGAAKYEAFPVDTWILQAMTRRYGLHGWRPAQIAQFGRAHFGPLAGLAQQYLFSGERKEKK